MRLKTKLVLAITGMVFVLVAVLSSIYVSQLVQQRMREAWESGQFVAQETLYATRDAIQSGLSATRGNLADPQIFRAATAQALQNDHGLRSLLDSVVGYSTTIYDIAITDTDGRVLTHSDPEQNGQAMPQRPDFDAVRNGGFLRQLRVVYGPPVVYTISIPLDRNGKPFVSVRVGLSSTFLKSDLQPQLHRAILLSSTAILLSLAFAAILSNFALRPLELISRRLDQLSSGDSPGPAATGGPLDEYGAVSTKIERIGREMRDVKEVFSALKENLDQIMANLQDGIVLFTRDSRAVLVSASAEKFLRRPRREILGNDAGSIFDPTTELGSLVLQAFRDHRPIAAAEVGSDGQRTQVSLDFIEQGEESLGALLTLRDPESVRRIEDEIEFSRRLAAIGRLTSGVAHEVKNPINAIVVHLELLKQKLQSAPADADRHMEIIGSEVRRLDRVVQTLVDFSKPVELRLGEIDLRRLVSDVLVLAAADFENHKVHLQSRLPSFPVRITADEDLIKQAVLNIVINGAQAMSNGGNLWVSLWTEGPDAVLSVRDEGTGISPEIQDKIFNLYFTTKKEGSGIGLAITYRILQLHSGSIDVKSAAGQGATFLMRLPIASGGDSVVPVRSAWQGAAEAR